MIHATGISVRLGTRHVLRNIDLRVDEGQAVAIIGPNGAGKSTLMRVLAGVLDPTHGNVSRPGLTPRERASYVAYVPQAHGVTFEFTVLEFVLMAFHVQNSRWALESKAQVDAAMLALDKLQVSGLHDQPITALSSGEFQRVLMARTLASRAVVWLLDEPTSNLDLKHQITLLELLREHVEQGGIAVSIFHDLGLVTRYFDRVVALNGGELAFDGPANAVMTPENLSTLFDVNLTRLSDTRHVAYVATSLDPDPHSDV
ncbi:MAG: ABC transporter ATP-binding protein [bacterium]